MQKHSQHHASQHVHLVVVVNERASITSLDMLPSQIKPSCLRKTLHWFYPEIAAQKSGKYEKMEQHLFAIYINFMVLLWIFLKA